MSSTLRTQLRSVYGKRATKGLKVKYNGAFKHQRRSERKVEEKK